MKLRQLLDKVRISYMNADLDYDVKDVVNHSDKAFKGTVFAALAGEREDGYGYIKNALERGCEIILCDRMPYAGCSFIVTENAREAYAKMCAALYGDPQKRLDMYAVTGTNGKTTVSYMTRRIFSAAFGEEKTALCGGVENAIGLYKEPSDMTTPDPHELYGFFSKAERAGSRYVFIEASSHALDFDKLAPCRFKVGVFTNLTEDHLDHHGTMDAYFSSKKKLIRLSEKTVSNGDDPYMKTLDSPKFSLYKGDFTAEDLKLSSEGSEFIYKGYQNAKIKLKVPGLFNVYNALAAVCTAEISGISPDISAAALLGFKGAEGRFERIECKTGAAVIIDYAHTPDALKAALCAAAMFRRGGSLYCVFGCGGDRDKGKRPLMGAIASSYADMTVVTTDNSRSEDPLEIINEVLEGVDKEKRYAVIPDRREAVLFALRNSKEGDVVLLAGKGHEKYETGPYGKRPFSEKDIIKEFNGKGKN